MIPNEKASSSSSGDSRPVGNDNNRSLSSGGGIERYFRLSLSRTDVTKFIAGGTGVASSLSGAECPAR